MNTREKIHSFDFLESLRNQNDWVLVAGFFDPLTSEQAQHLAKQSAPGKKLLAVVIDAPDTLLNAEARAILVASLRCVTAVVTCSEEVWQQFVNGAARQIADGLESDRSRTAEFVEFVLQRQQLSTAGVVSGE